MSIVGFEDLGGDGGIGGIEGVLGPKLDVHERAIGSGQFGHFLVGCFGECHVYLANYRPAKGSRGKVFVGTFEEKEIDDRQEYKEQD